MIGDSASSIAEDPQGPKSSASSYYSSALHNVIHGQRKGKSRKEAFENLDIKKAELLSTGEIKLPNGKIIGHRDYRHIYRQRTRLPDQREAIVINKLALEYRKMQHAGDGIVMTANNGQGGKHFDYQQQAEDQHGKQRLKFLRKKDKDSVAVGCKNSTTMMKYFRI